MKAKTVVLILGVAALAGSSGWLAGRKSHSHPAPTDHAAETGGERKVLFYQSPMHPWVKSDKPGRCTICGMELSPVYEGEKGFNAQAGVVVLGSNTVQVINVASDEVKRAPLRRTMRVAGTIDDNDAKHRFVSAYVEGRVDRLAVNFVGAEVVAGQPLATLYSPTLLAAEREYLALRGQSRGAEGNPLTTEHGRILDAAAQRLKRFGLTDAQLETLATKGENDIETEITAPVTGTVVARFVYEGQYVKEGEKLFEIADFSTMWFLFDAYERDLGWLQLGQKVEVTTPSVPGGTFEGTVAFIDPNLKEMTRSAKVRVELPNPLIDEAGRKHRQLLHRLFAEAIVQVETPEVLSVPRSAVLAPGSVAVVYVERGGGSYEQRRVKLGRAGDELWEVLEGLSAGERVVTHGSLLLDAQAQLNSNGSGMAEPDRGTNAPSPAPLPPLMDTQRQAARDFLTLVDSLGTALASDDLKEFNAQTAQSHSVVPALTKNFVIESGWRNLVRPIELAGHLSEAVDLKAARKSFHPLSVAAVALAQALRRQDAQFGSLKVFRCPMTKDSFPGAPRTAEWLQLKPAIRNPWFGAEMIDCGSEVKP